MLGGLQRSACCSNPVPDVEVPACPFTSLSCNFQERSNFTASNLIYEAITFRSNHPGCVGAQETLVTGWDVYGISAFPSASSVRIEAVATSSATWVLNSETILTLNNGPILRRGTNTVIARCSYRVRELTLTRTARTRTETQGVVQTQGIEKFNTDAGGECCSPSQNGPIHFPRYVEGPSVTISNPSAAETHVIRWVGVCNQAVVGMTISRNGSSPSTNPWKIQVTGGQIVLTNGAGQSTAYSGLLTNVRTALIATGLFTVNIPLTATASAETQDLLEMGPEYLLFNCPRQVRLADVGFPVAPGMPRSSGFEGQAFIASGGEIEYFDALSTGFENNVTGATQFMGTPRQPKLITVGGIGEFTFFDLRISTSWSLVPGNSTLTQSIVTAPSSSTSRIVTLTCGPICVSEEEYGSGSYINSGCLTLGECPSNGYSTFSPGFAPSPGLNGFGFQDCNFQQIKPLCPTEGTAFMYGCYEDEITITPNPELTFVHVRTIQGTMSLT
jgi:hypothetical protein